MSKPPRRMPRYPGEKMEPLPLTPLEHFFDWFTTAPFLEVLAAAGIVAIAVIALIAALSR